MAILLVCLPAACQTTSMFRGNLEHTGVYASGPVQQFGKIKWKFRTGGRVISSPAVANGMVYFGSTDGNLYALDLPSGAQKWKFPTEVRVTSSPAVDHGIVYFGSYNGNFYALDGATGALKWKFRTAGERRFSAKHLLGIQPDGETMPDPFDFYLSVAGGVEWGGLLRQRRRQRLRSRSRLGAPAMDIFRRGRGPCLLGGL